MRKKFEKTSTQNVKLSFVPEVVHTIMSDLVARIDVTQDDMERLYEASDKYSSKMPIIKVIVTAPNGETITFQNMQFYIDGQIIFYPIICTG